METNEKEVSTNREDVFAHADIVVLAEAHGQHDAEIAKFLAEHLREIDAVFMEIPADYQSSIDNFAGIGVVDATLESWFTGAEREGKSIRGILENIAMIAAAKKPIICIDAAKSPFGEYTRKAADGYYFLRGESRDEDMFARIEEYRSSNPGKFLVITGQTHVKTDVHPRTGTQTLGKRLADTHGERYTPVVFNPMKSEDGQITE